MTQETITQSANEYILALKAAKAAYEKLDLDLTPEALNAGAATILIHATKMAPASNGHAGNGRAKEEHDPFGDVTCKFCEGPCWDNTRNKKNPKGPDYKCKDTDCGGAAWINQDKTILWKQ